MTDIHKTIPRNGKGENKSSANSEIDDVMFSFKKI